MTSISPFHVKPTTQKEMTLADSFASLVKQYDKNIRPNYTGKCHTIRYWYQMHPSFFFIEWLHEETRPFTTIHTKFYYSITCDH